MDLDVLTKSSLVEKEDQWSVRYRLCVVSFHQMRLSSFDNLSGFVIYVSRYADKQDLNDAI